MANKGNRRPMSVRASGSPLRRASIASLTVQRCAIVFTFLIYFFDFVVVVDTLDLLDYSILRVLLIHPLLTKRYDLSVTMIAVIVAR